MKQLRNRRTAALIMVLTIVFSVFYGSYRSLRKESQQISRVFYQGVSGNGVGIASDLTARSDAAYNLATVAKRYLAETDTAVQAVLTARNALIEAGSIEEKYEANRVLTEATIELDMALRGTELEEKDENYRSMLMTELSSRNSTIQLDGYNQAAAEYNQMLQTFPASLFVKLYGFPEFPSFR